MYVPYHGTMVWYAVGVQVQLAKPPSHPGRRHPVPDSAKKLVEAEANLFFGRALPGNFVVVRELVFFEFGGRDGGSVDGMAAQWTVPRTLGHVQDPSTHRTMHTRAVPPRYCRGMGAGMWATGHSKL